MNGLIATILVAAVTAGPASAAPFTIGSGLGFSVAADPEGTVIAVIDDENRLSSCVLPYGARTCASRSKLKRPAGRQNGLKLLRRPSDGALFVLDHRTGGKLYALSSTDNGMTWSAPVLVATKFPDFSDAALASDGVHADIVGGFLGDPARFARVNLAGPPVTPFLNLSHAQRRGSAGLTSIASLDSGATIVEYLGAFTSDYGLRFHAPDGDLAADAEWTRWRPLFELHDQNVFAGEGKAYLAQVGGPLGRMNVKLREVTATGAVGAARLVHKRLDGIEPDGAVVDGTLHLIVSGLTTIQYTRTSGDCWFGKPVTFHDAGPSGIKLAMATPERGLIAWNLGSRVRGVWTRGGVDPACE
jgi:hypothetical protein